MARIIREAVEKEINRAIIADEQANARYYETIRRLIAAKPTSPDTKLEATNWKEMDAAWLAKESTAKNLRRAYMKLNGSHLQQTSSSDD